MKINSLTIDKIREPLVVALSCGVGSGSKVFQSFLDGHPEIYMIPGYPLMYFYSHWFQWQDEGRGDDWNSIINSFNYNHPTVLDTRLMPGSESLNCLGENQDEWLQLDAALFENILKQLLKDSEINSIHNLPLEKLKTALREISRVSRAHAYITVDAWRNDKEKEQLYKWVLTAETMMHVDDWKKLFAEVGYTGDYYWFIAD